VGLNIGGYNDEPNWPKMGPSLLIATCLIVAIRTARWSAQYDARNSNVELEREIDYAVHVAGNVLAALMKRCPSIFPTTKKPWYQATDEDLPK
jgi:hypothetical protein